jgi:magnesium chelatase subunit I
MRASAAEFILEGLYAQKRISRNEQLAYSASERPQKAERTEEEFRRGYDQRKGQGGGRRNLN